MLEENLKAVEEKIVAACERAGRKRGDVTLLAVGKTKPAAMIKQLYDLGVRDFGENKVQELSEKYAVLPRDISWHMIGHLQRNKVRQLLEKASLIHSVDSLRLAQTIDDEAGKKGLSSDILIEVNVAGEETKYGFSPDEVSEAVNKISLLKNLRVRGLMTIAPYVTNPEENRPVFAALRKISVDIGSKNIDNVSMDILSMGMSGDYEVAIEEGATIVRVGTALFGARDYDIA